MRSWPIVFLRLPYLAFSSVLALARLLPVSDTEKTIEILALRHRLAVLGITMASSTVWEILKKHGVPPAPDRDHTTWPAFLRGQAQALLACDFFTAVTLSGANFHVFVAIEHATRRVWCWTCDRDSELVRQHGTSSARRDLRGLARSARCYRVSTPAWTVWPRRSPPSGTSSTRARRPERAITW